jgi:methionine-gamma-lyase
MAKYTPKYGMGSLVNIVGEREDPQHSHVMPIYQTSLFDFTDVASGAALFKGEEQGHIYSRLSNPNQAQVAHKIAVLEGLDLLRANPDTPTEEIVAGQIFSSGMAAVTSCILAKVKPGQTILAQEALYSATYSFLNSFGPQWGIKVAWVPDPTPQAWKEAFVKHPDAVLAYVETPSNPTLSLVDIRAVVAAAKDAGAWVMVDNTFATPYCQRPLTLGADIVVHSTTKYLNGHGLVIGGAAVSTHVKWMKEDLYNIMKTMGCNASPFDAWLTNTGMKTFELRMQRHCQNAKLVMSYLEQHPAIGNVYYPGLPSHPDYELATKQMLHYGGMAAFEMAGGLEAGAKLMDNVKLCVLAVSLGHVNTLIQHPASMTHSSMDPEERRKTGISDGLVRFSIGIENVEDIIADLEQALKKV